LFGGFALVRPRQKGDGSLEEQLFPLLLALFPNYCLPTAAIATTNAGAYGAGQSATSEGDEN